MCVIAILSVKCSRCMRWIMPLTLRELFDLDRKGMLSLVQKQRWLATIQLYSVSTIRTMCRNAEHPRHRKQTTERQLWKKTSGWERGLYQSHGVIKRSLDEERGTKVFFFSLSLFFSEACQRWHKKTSVNSVAAGWRREGRYLEKNTRVLEHQVLTQSAQR